MRLSEMKFTEGHALMVLIGCVLLMLVLDLYLTYRNTILVCGEQIVLVYKMMGYENPQQCAKCVQDCQNNATLHVIQTEFLVNK